MMRPDELRRVLSALDLDHREAAEALGVCPATIRHWLSGRHSVPGPAARLLRLWLRVNDLRPHAEEEEGAGEEVFR